MPVIVTMTSRPRTARRPLRARGCRLTLHGAAQLHLLLRVPGLFDLFLWDLTRMLGVPWIELADDAVRDLHRWSRVYPPRSPAAGGRPYSGLAPHRR